ncbi:MAG: hypothetical protein JWO73_19 [Candidatus Taylorbacteria bacterium]|nr:hypothetical protein [Candidatus Taylorbacteria bacterium]
MRPWRLLNDLGYLSERFGDGQLEIQNETKGIVFRGDILKFGGNREKVIVTLNWLAKSCWPNPTKWEYTQERDLIVKIVQSNTDDDCFQEGRIGIRFDNSEKVMMIIPRRHPSCFGLNDLKGARVRQIPSF